MVIMQLYRYRFGEQMSCSLALTYVGSFAANIRMICWARHSKMSTKSVTWAGVITIIHLDTRRLRPDLYPSALYTVTHMCTVSLPQLVAYKGHGLRPIDWYSLWHAWSCQSSSRLPEVQTWHPPALIAPIVCPSYSHIQHIVHLHVQVGHKIWHYLPC